MLQDPPILKLAADYMTSFLVELPPKLTFHNFVHTLEVVRAARKIGRAISLPGAGMEIVELAAWFHDAGYKNRYIGHEYDSIEIADIFLRDKNYPEDRIAQVVSCINATRVPQSPQDELGKVVCDADLFHFSSPGYPQHEQALRTEWELLLERCYTDEEWAEANCEILSEHTYFTDFGKTILQEMKEENIRLLRCRFS